jgi:hypothetical protein
VGTIASGTIRPVLLATGAGRRYARPVIEGFDGGERAGAYLRPMLLSADGKHAGGSLVTLTRGESGAAFHELEPVLRAARTPLVFTPPVYAGDAVAGRNPLFAVRALREFVAICLRQNPESAARRRRG